ncbi:hypothetical protein FACS1894105_04710 [Clostridia bacterium]|nr:hypothetical protein FACS1894105_04710 [Clostridia bacterium]GHV14732.1 hypothetical protein FACS1894219_11080 [Clostridia bacterium]
MLIIVAKNTLKPGKTVDFKAAAKELIEKSRAEAGNISYDLYEDVSNPDVLTFIEHWKDQAAIDFHSSQSHFNDTIPKLAALSVKDMEVTIYKNS